ncbi:MAG: hypothetical protein A3H50_01505 [Candidatus Levybacteria bacterium RIFCSPLOWO2_02_FULL_37_10]|nr:MAG: hypothetical protein A2860_03215 [Candidatus Levybacteria bacterium RIFCSPHIGHO2_01_FULL_37_33]OGH16909.1 MAG: hypothetical protein A3C97_00115 [Candidatus Levybacteria bacterium RIFCSPHIGHO2_02_FULL_37_11]OGH29875.1 MAG: hypothetical protein A3F30_01650 [Candidatus Levybacteria bacterium RIFCSPHIGHO2_12_FULL_37_12]OGH32981.1 MAG: hypothetical protein A2953_01010 [Candidatus Levybacteria bacterium RIFCSPLOWO2_01_FULL_36_54]OGH43345.1 MAG: hypothetical protein A3H50_01505 [Candidatus Lev
MRKDHKFSKSEAIKFGLTITKRELKFFIGIFVIFILVNFAFNILAKDISQSFPFYFSIIVTIALSLVGTILQMGLIKISLNFLDNKKSQHIDLFTTHRPVFKFLTASILYGLIVFAGFILLVIPGIIWAIKFQFYSYLIVDKEMGPIEALKKSSQITKGVKLDLLVFSFLLTGINILGVLAFGIGLILTIPTTIIATAFVYRKLLSKTSGV